MGESITWASTNWISVTLMKLMSGPIARSTVPRPATTVDISA